MDRGDDDGLLEMEESWGQPHPDLQAYQQAWYPAQDEAAQRRAFEANQALEAEFEETLEDDDSSYDPYDPFGPYDDDDPLDFDGENDEDLLEALDEALEEIDREMRAEEIRERVAPSYDVMEHFPPPEMAYRRMIRHFHGDQAPRAPHEEDKHHRPTIANGSLAQMLTMSVTRSHAAVEQRKAARKAFWDSYRR